MENAANISQVPTRKANNIKPSSHTEFFQRIYGNLEISSSPSKKDNKGKCICKLKFQNFYYILKASKKKIFFLHFSKWHNFLIGN